MGNTVEQWRASIGSWKRGSGGEMLMKCRGSSSSSPWFQLLVLVVLLVIGGVEMNPGPNQAVPSRYKKTTGAADMSGELFETKTSALLFLRAVNSQREFRIASNMAAAGSYDDIVFTLGHQTAFLQLKHRQNAKVYTSQLLTVKGDFSLLRYCKSYFDIKSQWPQNQDLQHCGRFEDSFFIVFTNASLVGTVASNVGSSEVLDLLNTQGKLIQFTVQQHPLIYELFRSLPRYKQLLSEAVNGGHVPNTSELLEVVKTLLNNTATRVPEKKDLVKLLAELDSLGDLSGYAEFLSRLCFCTEQAQESVLDKLIKSEFNAVCGNDAFFHDFTLGIQNWWRKSKTYLTDKAKFFQDIIQSIAANITKHSSLLKVKFVQNERDIITQILRSGNTKIYMKTECCNLSCVKVLQSFETNLLVDVSTLQTRVREVVSVWRLGMCDVLVVEGEITDTTVLNKLGSMPDSKCVVVITDQAEHTQLYQQFQFVTFSDTFCLSHFDAVSQTYILEQDVMFQGFPVKLDSLAEVSFLQTAVTADVVVQLHHTLKIGQQLEKLDPCYLERTFLRKVFISEQIFREQHITLAVTEISEDRLAQLVPRGEEGQNQKTCKCFRIEGESEFTALCGNNDNIHWIEARKRGFVWVKSKGDISPVVKHLVDKNVAYASNEILELPHQVVLVVAEPGMGKTTEMCNLTHMIKHKYPSTWVIRVDLNEHTALLSRDQVDAVEFLQTVATLNTEFQKRLFEHQLQSGGNLVILVDGVDEVSPNYSDQVIRLLKEFSVMKVRKIFVTSRPVMLNELQQNLSILAFSFQEFTSDDQENYLMRFWNGISINSPKLSGFIFSLLELVGTSLNDNLKELTGIPLQCKMLAEVYTVEAAHFCQTGENMLPENLDILDLYDKFVDKKWDVYWNKIKVDIKTAFSLVTSHKDMFHQSLMCCALVSYLHDDDVRKLQSSDDVLKQNQDFVQNFGFGQDKTGIVTHIVGNKAVFVHRTFTEYFVAMWCSQNFEKDSFMMPKMYFDKNFVVVRKFLDRILAKLLKLHTFVLNENLTEVENQLTKQNPDVNRKDKGGRTALHLAITNYLDRVYETNDSIVETLLGHGADVNCEDKVLHWRPLRLAEEVRAWSVVDKLLEKQADDKDLVWVRKNIEKQMVLQNPRKQGFVKAMSAVFRPRRKLWYCMSESLEEVMRTSLCEGYVNLVQFILNCGVSVTHYITDSYRDKTTMLHIAAEHRQLRLVQFLIHQGADVEISGGWYKRTPLMWAAVHGHVELVQLLISHGARVNTRDKDRYTALSLAAREGKNETVKLLLQQGADVEISGGLFNRTPLMWAAEGGHVEVVELLISHGACVNTRDDDRDTALSLAAREGKNETLKLLLQLTTWNTNDIDTVICHAGCGDVEAVQYLLDNDIINSQDKDGYTALLLAAQLGNTDTVKLLLQKGADVEISVGLFNITPLMRTALPGHEEVVQLLLPGGCRISTRDKLGHNALLLAASDNIKQLLLQHGARE